MSLRRVLAVALALAAFVVGPVAPVAADPARPTNDRAEVVAIEPAIEGVRVDVVGGDAFLRVRVATGHRVDVPGYSGEPYLRIDGAGLVERNERSPATWLNSARYGPTATAPSEVDAEAEPAWTGAGSGGEHVWHDHRIHAMGGPPQRDWEVPLVVDGTPVRVLGRLTSLTPPNPWPWRVLALGWAGLAVAALVWRPRLGAVALGLVALGAVVVGVAEVRALPGEAGPGLTAVALPALAALAGAMAVGVGVQRRPSVGGPLVAGAGIALTMWAWRRHAVLDRAVLLSGLPEAVERALVAAALGTGVAATVIGVVVSVGGWHGVRRPPVTAPAA